MGFEDKAKAVFGERASHYATSGAHTDTDVLQRVVAASEPQANWDALDVATGAGHTAFALAPHVGRVLGVDLTAQMVEQALLLKSEYRLNNVVFALADVHRLPFRKHSFDLVTSRLAAHHFSDIGAALEEMRRVLRKGGRIVINDRSVPEDDFIDEALNRLDALHDESHVRQYRASEWEEMLTRHGFRVDICELYSKSRPLASLTKGVRERDVRAIHEILGSLTRAQQESLGYENSGGGPVINHWYVLITRRLSGLG